jgi:hypothetical protein
MGYQELFLEQEMKLAFGISVTIMYAVGLLTMLGLVSIGMCVSNAAQLAGCSFELSKLIYGIFMVSAAYLMFGSYRRSWTCMHKKLTRKLFRVIRASLI